MDRREIITDQDILKITSLISTMHHLPLATEIKKRQATVLKLDKKVTPTLLLPKCVENTWFIVLNT